MYVCVYAHIYVYMYMYISYIHVYMHTVCMYTCTLVRLLLSASREPMSGATRRRLLHALLVRAGVELLHKALVRLPRVHRGGARGRLSLHLLGRLLAVAVEHVVATSAG